MHCPGCGAPLTRLPELDETIDGGFLICAHGHIYDLDDPDDDRSLRTAMGSEYKRRFVYLADAS
jgi:hypothetical protein